MLGKVTVLASIEVQPVESRIQFVPSTSYIIQTDNIVKMKVSGSTDSELRYKLHSKEDRTTDLLMIVDQTNTQVQALADVAANSNMVALSVYEGVLSFGDATGTPVTKYFNVSEIVWGEENSDADKTKIWVMEGGHSLKSYFVNANLDQIIDLVTTGTTTTTTSTTSTTSTSTTSTSTSTTTTPTTSTSTTTTPTTSTSTTTTTGA